MKPRARSLRHILIRWVAVTAAAVVLLTLFTSATTSILERMAGRIRADAAGATAAIQFEKSILAWSRDDLLRREDGDPESAERIAAHRRDAETLLARLTEHFPAPEEAPLIEEIASAHAAFRAAADRDDGAGMRAVLPDAERLMEGSRRLARHAERKMDATLSSGAALGRVVNLVCALALVLSPLFLGIAAWHLWTRIIRSALGLSAAARAFGAGEMKARAAVDEDDEMGEVCRTFNVMAEAIAARDRDRFDFMAAVAHDLQNPLSAIIGTTDLLRQNEAAPEAKRRAWLDRITAQSRRLELMTFNLTDTVQKMTGRVALQTRPLDLERLIREVAEEQAGTVREDRVIRVRVEKRPIVLGDAAQLERVFANLLSNALKYSDERSEIDVALEIRGEEAVATVTDRGIGISPEELRDIFEPYWREGGTAGRVRGTGLGLFAAHSIVVAHGGRITIDSERGAGTTVTVTLPLESELAASRPEPG